MKKKLELRKRSKSIIGVLVVVATIAYLLVSVALAQSGATSTSKSNMNYTRDRLSWGDVWSFGSAEYQASKYKNQNGTQLEMPIYISKEKDKKDTINISLQKYYGKVRTGNHTDVSDAVALSTYAEDKFVNGSITENSVNAPIGLSGAKIPTVSTNGTAVYSVVPNSTGDYRIYVYSPNGNPASAVHYALLEDYSTNNNYSTQMTTARTWTQVGNDTGWYYTELHVNYLSWSAFEISVVNDGTNSSPADDTNGNESFEKTYTSLWSSSYYYYNTWSHNEHIYNTVLAIQFSSNVQLGPITGKSDTITVNSGSDGTITAYDPFGEIYTTETANYHMPIFFKAEPSGEASFAGFTDSSNNAVTVTTLTENDTNYYEYSFETTTTLNAGWEVMIDFPQVNVSGGATATAHYYLNKAGSANYPYSTETEFTFTADYTDAVSSPITYSAVANGTTVASGILETTGDSFTLPVQWYETVVTFTSTHETTTRTMTYTMSPYTYGVTAVAKIGSTYYYTLEDALVASKNGDTVVMLTSYAFQTGERKTEWGSMAGGVGYTVKSGVTLLVPHKSSVTSVPSSGTVANHPYSCEDQINTTSVATAAAISDNVYMELTVSGGVTLNLENNAKFIVGGSVNGTGLISKGDTTAAYHSNVKLEDNASVVAKNGSIMSTCGFIYGDGTVTEENGSKVYVPFSVLDFRGGGYTVSTALNITDISKSGLLQMATVTKSIDGFPSGENAITPFVRYAMTAIQAHQIIKKGANVTGYVDLYTDQGHSNSTIPIIGTSTSNSLVALTADTSYLDVTYNSGVYASTYPAVGKMYVQVHGNAAYGGLSLDVNIQTDYGDLGAVVDSKQVNFPLPYNFSFEIASGTFSVPNPLALYPGASVTVDSGAELDVSSTFTVYDGLTDYTAGPSGSRNVVLKSHQSGYSIYHKTNNPSGTHDAATPSNNYPTSAVLQEASFGGSGSADLVVNGTMRLMSGASFGGVVQTNGTGSLIVDSNVGTSTTTQVGMCAYSYLNVSALGKNVEKKYYFAGATVRTLQAQVIDPGTGKRTAIIPGMTYSPAGGADAISEYEYELYYDSNNKLHETRTESVSALLQGGWYNYTVNVHVLRNGVVLSTNTVYFAHGADLTDLGYYTDQACTIPATTVTSSGDLYTNGAVAKVVWADGITPDSYYPTLRAAVKDAVNENDTVVLLEDLSALNETIGIAESQSIMIDLDGHSVTYSKTAFSNDGSVTLDINGGALSNDASFSGGAVVNAGEMELKLGGGTITSAAVVADDGSHTVVVTNNGDMTLDLEGGMISLTNNAVSTGKTNAILNTGTLSITNSGTTDSTHGVISNNSWRTAHGITASAEVYQAVVRNAGENAVLTINAGLTLSQPQTVYGTNAEDTFTSVGLVNVNGATIVDTKANINVPTGAAIYNFSGMIQSISGGTITAKQGIYNRNMRTADASTSPLGYQVPFVATIDYIGGNVSVEVARYAVHNRSVINTIGGNAVLKAADYVVNVRGDNWYFDSQLKKQTNSSSSPYTRVNSYDTNNIGRIGEIGGSVLIQATTNFAVHVTGGGILESITGGTITAPKQAIRVIGVRYTGITYTYFDKNGGVLNTQDTNYAGSRLRLISGGTITATGGSYAIENYAYIDGITGGTFTASSGSTIANLNSDGNQYARIQYARTANATTYDINRTYNYFQATIGSIGAVTINAGNTGANNSAILNRGLISEISDTVLNGKSYVLTNSDGANNTCSSTRTTLHRYVENTTAGEKDLTRTYYVPTITKINNVTVNYTSYGLRNYGYIGEIKNSKISTTGGERAIDNESYTRTSLAYTYTWDSHTPTVATTTTEWVPGEINLIGAGNTIKATTNVVINFGKINAINGGDTTSITATNGVAVYNYRGLKIADNGASYVDPVIGKIRNVIITATGYGIKNGEGNATYGTATLNEIAAGTEITSTGEDAVRNMASAKIGTISGGIFAATKSGKYGFYNNNTAEGFATAISGGDFKGMSATRANAIYEPDNTSRQTYPEGLTLSSGTESVTLHDGTTATGYYYITNTRSYTVKWMDWSGTNELDSTTVEYNAPVPAYPGQAPTKAETVEATYQFNGWAESAKQSAGIDLSGRTVTGDVTYYAAFLVISKPYVEFLSGTNDISVTMPNEYFVADDFAGQKLTACAFTREGYEFVHWVDSKGQVYQDQEKIIFTSSMGAKLTLTAVWKSTGETAAPIIVSWFDGYKDQKDVPIYFRDMAGQTVPAQNYYTDISQLAQPTAPSYLGYRFKGWTVYVGTEDTPRVTAWNQGNGDQVTITNEQLQTYLSAHLKNGEYSFRIYAEYAELDNSVGVNISYKFDNTPKDSVASGNEVKGSDRAVIGKSYSATALAEITENGTKYYFDHWEYNGEKVTSATEVIIRLSSTAEDISLVACYSTSKPDAGDSRVAYYVTETYAERVNGVPKVAVTMAFSILDPDYTVTKVGFYCGKDYNAIRGDKPSIAKSSKVPSNNVAGSYTLHISSKSDLTQDVYARAYVVLSDGTELIAPEIVTLNWTVLAGDNEEKVRVS